MNVQSLSIDYDVKSFYLRIFDSVWWAPESVKPFNFITWWETEKLKNGSDHVGSGK